MKHDVDAALNQLEGPYDNALSYYEQLAKVYAAHGGKLKKQDKQSHKALTAKAKP